MAYQLFSCFVVPVGGECLLKHALDDFAGEVKASGLWDFLSWRLRKVQEKLCLFSRYMMKCIGLSYPSRTMEAIS